MVIVHGDAYRVHMITAHVTQHASGAISVFTYRHTATATRTAMRSYYYHGIGTYQLLLDSG